MVFQKDYNQEIPDEKQSRLNAAGLINSTLENLWKDCYNSMAKGDLTLWNRKLDAIWNILGGDVKEGEQEDKDIEKINMSLYKTGSFNHKKFGFQRPDPKENEIMALQYLLLNKKSLFLRRLQNKQGKGTAYASDDDYDFD